MKSLFPFAAGFLLVFFLAENAFTNPLVAQQTLQVVTKRIHKTIPHPAGGGLQIDAQRADIHISTWEEDSLRLELRLVAKHPEKATATRELETMKYFMDRVGNTVVIRNFLASDNQAPQPASTLKAVYFIWVPAACSLEIRNSFGYVEIRGLRAPVKVNGEYCDMAFFDYDGAMNVHSYFGDMEGEGLSSKITWDADRSDVSMTGFAGDLSLSARYGSVGLNLAAEAGDIRIKAERTDLRISGVSAARHRFSLHTSNGTLEVPPTFGLVFGQNQQSAWSESNRAAKLLDLRTTFGKILLEGENP